ncbi:MAG: acyl carrier protein [Alphaproteobacteria bacterium]|nr:acyl carrier protein [Alphaproteobacteria bacterium]MBM3653010.1 acyl carrier protein [Alphaproteobacteria bacterium]
MTEAEIRALILELIGEIAPEADLGSAQDQDDLREIFDLDSMDFANLVVALHDRLGVNIPEVHYNQLFKLESAIAFLRNAIVQ